MPLTYLLYRCPRCGHDPLEGEKDEATCSGCGTRYARGGEGGLILVREPSGEVWEVPGHRLTTAMEGWMEEKPSASGVSGASIHESQVEVTQSGEEAPVWWGGELLGFAEAMGEARDREASFSPMRRSSFLHYLEKRGALQEESPPRAGPSWRSGLSRRVRVLFSFLPRVGGWSSFGFPMTRPFGGRLSCGMPFGGRTGGRVWGRSWSFSPGSSSNDRIRGETMTWYRLFQLILTLFAHAVARLEVVGRENIPKTGPFILVANHQSFLDPIIVQVLCRRPLHTLAKSTQFTGRFMGWFMPRSNAIPTRRYRIEPQAVRVVLRRLAEGEAVGVYPEGERSWDAQLQPFRRGTIRLLLKSGVPVIPCGLSGAYDVWPRWSKTIRRRRIRVEFGEAIRWPAMDREGRAKCLCAGGR